MKLLRTIYGEADEKVLFMEEPAPVVIKEGAIGLKIVFAADMRGTVPLL
jgi:hypothetical protein